MRPFSKQGISPKIQVVLPPEVFDRLEEDAEKRGIKVVQVAREIIKKYYQKR
jgi:hypothetical protein